MKTWIKKPGVIPAVIILICGLNLCLFGCSSNNRTSAFQIAFCSLQINERAVTEYGTFLQNEIPELTIDGTAPVFTSIIMGEVVNDFESGIFSDPMMGIGGMMRMTAITATSDIDVMISDMANAARYAVSGMFLPLSAVFTNDDLEALENRLLSFDIVSMDGIETIPTGERTPVCGINISGNERIRNIFGNQEIGVFIVANTKRPEIAKKVVMSLL